MTTFLAITVATVSSFITGFLLWTFAPIGFVIWLVGLLLILFGKQLWDLRDRHVAREIERNRHG
jgi:uncharacterized membrane protein